MTWSVISIALLLAATLVYLHRRKGPHIKATRDSHGAPPLLDQLGAALPDGLVIASLDTVHYANAAAASMLQMPELADIGRFLFATFSGSDVAQPPATAQIQLKRADGSAFNASVSSHPIVHEGQSCRLFVIHDLSELEHGRNALAASNAELQAMAGRLFSLQEDERRSISRDLHDDIGQAITAMKLAAGAARDEENTARRREDIDQIIELADCTVVKLRNLSMLLRPPQLDALGLEAALRWQANMLFRSTSVELLLNVDTLAHRPGNEVEQACFRIAQEGLTNALRHARASQVSLLLRDGREGELLLQVVDDGEGFDPSAPRGLGMIVMRERAQSAGGSLQIETAPGEGTCINLRLPYTRVR